MLASFDGDGNLAAWGLGETTDELVSMRVCPGSTTIVGMILGPNGEARVVRRDVATLLPVGSATLPDRPPNTSPNILATRGFDCTSPDGDVAFLVSASGYVDGADNIVVWMDGDSSTTHYIDEGWGFAVAPDETSGYLLTGEHGTLLERITLADGTRQRLTELPDGVGGRYVAVDAATGRIAVVATSNPTLHSRGDPAAPDDRLVVLDSGGAVLATAALPAPRLIDSVTWMDHDRLLVVSSLPTTMVDVITLDGTVWSTVAELTGPVAVAGEHLYVATEDGVVEMTLDGRDRRLLAPGIARVHAVVAVPAGPAAAPQPAPTILVTPPDPSTTAAATSAEPSTTPPPVTEETTEVTTAPTPVTVVGAETGTGDGSSAPIVGVAIVIVIVAALAGATAVVRHRRHALHAG
jgi:hypothetical protein